MMMTLLMTLSIRINVVTRANIPNGELLTNLEKKCFRWNMMQSGILRIRIETLLLHLKMVSGEESIFRILKQIKILL